MPFCPRCKTVVRDDRETCRMCGGTLPPRRKFDPEKDGWPWEKHNRDNPYRPEDDPEYNMIDPEPKSLAGVIILNLFIAGAGQIYLGQTGKGFLLMLPSLIGFFGGMGLRNSRNYGMSQGEAKIIIALMICMVIITWIVYIAAIVDGVLIANKMNQDKMVGKWEWF